MITCECVFTAVTCIHTNLDPQRNVTTFLYVLFLIKFILLYNTVLVLPYIDFNLPWVYMCVPHPEPPSPLPPHPIPLGIIYMFQCHSPLSSHPRPLPQDVLWVHPTLTLSSHSVCLVRYSVLQQSHSPKPVLLAEPTEIGSSKDSEILYSLRKFLPFYSNPILHIRCRLLEMKPRRSVSQGKFLLSVLPQIILEIM